MFIKYLLRYIVRRIVDIYRAVDGLIYSCEKTLFGDMFAVVYFENGRFRAVSISQFPRGYLL